MSTADWALVISIFSFLVSLSAFVWNVCSKFIFPKPKVRISFHVVNVIDLDGRDDVQVISLSATNYGPGAVTLRTILARERYQWWRRYRYSSLMPLHNFPNDLNSVQGPFGGGLPKKLDVGEEFSSFLTLNHSYLRDEPVVHVGFTDTFDRKHWASRKQVAAVRAAIAQTFPAPSGANAQ